jgi:hypothetical protein
MKNARPHNKESSDLDSRRCIGAFPVRYDTVTAEVLCQLICGETVTGMDAVFAANTTRLSAFIYTLRNSYGWLIEHRDIAVGTKDGRVAEIRAYFLHRGVIREALAMDAMAFCKTVKAARQKRRKSAGKAYREARTRNARRMAAALNPHQLALEY